VGLLLAGAIERFVRAKRYDGKPLDVEASPDLTRDDMYLRRLLPRWDELSRALGGEESVFERFEISSERTLRAIHAGIPGAVRLFALLMAKVPGAQHVHKSDLVAAVAEMEPRGNLMRELIVPLLLTPFWAEVLPITGQNSGPEKYLPNTSGGMPICAPRSSMRSEPTGITPEQPERSPNCCCARTTLWWRNCWSRGFKGAAMGSARISSWSPRFPPLTRLLTKLQGC
jgi:hypothetical protein